MDAGPKEDFCLLADEKFDFDLSSSSSTNEDDEVFFGPVGHKERCIATNIEFSEKLPEQPVLPAAASPCTWSPLTGEKFVEVYKEAHLLALQIESCSRREVALPTQPEASWSQDMERFVQESKLKINLFNRVQEMEKSPKSLKRETYFLLDSPLKSSSGDQPHSGEPQLLPCSPVLPAAPARAHPAPIPPHSSQPLPGGPSAARLPKHTVPPKMTRLQPPRALSARGKHLQLVMEKPKKETAASPSKARPRDDRGFPGEVCPDRPSTALDATTLPAGGSRLGQGKRLLPVPNKLGLKKTLLKPPGCAGSLARKPSSSGSAVSVSPAAGRAKPSERTGIPSGSSRPLSHISKLSRAGLTMLRQPLPAAPAGPPCGLARRPGVAQVSEQPKLPTTSPLAQSQMPEAGGLRLDPHSVSSTSQLNGTRGLRRQDVCLNAKTKAVLAPANPFKVPTCPAGESPKGVTPKSSRAQWLQSWAAAGRATVHSTPVRRSLGPASQDLSGTRTPVSARRVSALPTPSGRRLSGLPLMTPQSVPRVLASPLCGPARRLSSEPRKRSVVRTELAQELQQKASCAQVGLGLPSSESPSPPFSIPQALHFSPEKSDFSPEGSTVGEAQDEAKPCSGSHPSEAIFIDMGLDQLSTAPEEGRPPAALPLIDMGLDQLSLAPEEGRPPAALPLIDMGLDQLSLAPEEGRPPAALPLIDVGLDQLSTTPEEGRPPAALPLIDFCSTPEMGAGLGLHSRPLMDLMMNTPDVGRNDAVKPLRAEQRQLIDLGSPLIQLSPEADKENMDSPLLKF
ncbi:G2 and S phase-expressed protein 1 [Dipodomys merriami]|uniref:G2 and S phase-expressed protein 1 n=1 Tax=Dipodomys merriami TaxID=94247 RepID=UPI003856088F